MSRQGQDAQLSQSLDRWMQRRRRILQDVQPGMRGLVRQGQNHQSSGALGLIEEVQKRLVEMQTLEMEQAAVIARVQRLQHYCIAVWRNLDGGGSGNLLAATGTGDGASPRTVTASMARCSAWSNALQAPQRLRRAAEVGRSRWLQAPSPRGTGSKRPSAGLPEEPQMDAKDAGSAAAIQGDPTRVDGAVSLRLQDLEPSCRPC